MNALNALIFAILGAALEILPFLFPSWFPRNSADRESTRALWLAFMGAVQISVAAGFLIRAYLFPILVRLAFRVPASGQNALPLPAARGLTGH